MAGDAAVFRVYFSADARLGEDRLQVLVESCSPLRCPSVRVVGGKRSVEPEAERGPAPADLRPADVCLPAARARCVVVAHPLDHVVYERHLRRRLLAEGPGGSAELSRGGCLHAGVDDRLEVSVKVADVALGRRRGQGRQRLVALLDLLAFPVEIDGELAW